MGLELYRGFEHFERRGIGRALGAAGFTEHARDLGHGLDETIGLLQELGRLACGKAGQCGRHIQQIALVERRHEFAAELTRRPKRHDEDRNGGEQNRFRTAQRTFEQWTIERDEETVDRISFFGRDAPADEITHQHRNERDRQPSRRGHGIGLGEGERREEPSLLSFERKHRNERESDDQQRNEKRRSDLGRGLADHAPAFLARERRARVRVVPGFEALVRVLDHDHRGVHHRADRNGDAA